MGAGTGGFAPAFPWLVPLGPDSDPVPGATEFSADGAGDAGVPQGAPPPAGGSNVGVPRSTRWMPLRTVSSKSPLFNVSSEMSV